MNARPTLAKTVISFAFLAAASGSALGGIIYTARSGEINVNAPGAGWSSQHSGSGLSDLSFHIHDWWGYQWVYPDTYIYSSGSSFLETRYRPDSMELFGGTSGVGNAFVESLTSVTFTLSSSTLFYGSVGSSGSIAISNALGTFLSVNRDSPGAWGSLDPGTYTVNGACYGWFRFGLGVPAPGTASLLTAGVLLSMRRRRA